MTAAIPKREIPVIVDLGIWPYPQLYLYVISYIVEIGFNLKKYYLFGSHFKSDGKSNVLLIYYSANY